MTIFCAFVSESDPPKTVKSCAKAKTRRPSTRPGPADDAVARDDLIGHPEILTAMRDERVDLVERTGIEEQRDALARGQLAGLVLAPQPLFAAAQLGATQQLLEPPGRHRRYALATACACAFSQSFRNFSSPMSVSGCLNSASSTAGGHVQMSAPSRAACTM